MFREGYRDYSIMIERDTHDIHRAMEIKLASAPDENNTVKCMLIRSESCLSKYLQPRGKVYRWTGLYRKRETDQLFCN